MAIRAARLRRRAAQLLTLLGVGLLLVSLALLAKTTQNSEQFGRLLPWIVGINLTGASVLLALIVANLVRLAREFRQHATGARLKARMVGIFTVLALTPLAIVYAFSIQVLTRGIDSWFNVQIENGLNEALRLSRSVLDLYAKEQLGRTQAMAEQVGGTTEVRLIARLGELRRESGAIEITIFGAASRIIAVSSDLPAGTAPPRPPEELVMQVRQGRPYVDVEPLPSGRGLQVRTGTSIPVRTPTQEQRILQALYPVTERLNELGEIVGTTNGEYRKLAYLRKPLKYSFQLTLTLVLLVSALAAVWGAMFSARRLVAPIQDLVAGTRAVAKGDFDTRLPVPARDDIGFLVNSFNDMMLRLAEARHVAQESQQAVESERANLEAVLANLSTGVVALERDLRVRVANQAAQSILGSELPGGEMLPSAPEPQGTAASMFDKFAAYLRARLEAGDTDWREQVVLRGETGRRVLNCACAALPGDTESPGGYVVVFDDITVLLQAQRDAAWGEVARRLAHEIKNPLTPIQLSAERLRRRYLAHMGAADAEILDRATHTIIQQVEAMKEMVDAFRDYARAPDLDITRFDLNQLVLEVCELYRVRELGLTLRLELEGALPALEADSGRIRQILHNLVTNAVEALHGRPGGVVDVSTRRRDEEGQRMIELRVEDNGPGFPTETLEQIFEPYVTTKPKGTGLGLAIVKKIVEEHGGHIEAENRATGGARVSVLLPVDAGRATSLQRARSTEPKKESA
jgi:nitrogen fixation/metabolism regulation signal transduction histidine kinase